MTTPSEDQFIKLRSLRGRKETSLQIQNLLSKELNTPISKSTVRRRLSWSGLRVIVSKPLLRIETRPNTSGGGSGRFIAVTKGVHVRRQELE